jgi:TonB family protein
MPSCEYCPNPSYTEEARKAKFHGSVLLRVVITAGGRATNIRVVKGVGLGLDERAVESVRQWRFRPAIGPNGQPVETWTEIEINFRIY